MGCIYFGTPCDLLMWFLIKWLFFISLSLSLESATFINITNVYPHWGWLIITSQDQYPHELVFSFVVDYVEI